MVLKAKLTRRQKDSPHVEMFAPVAPLTDWVEVNTAVETADNSGSSVVLPSDIDQDRLMDVLGIGTSLMVMLGYDDALTVSADPVIQIFGKDSDGQYHALRNSDGNHEITLTTAASTDVQDGTLKWTVPIEVDLDGSQQVLVAIKTALAGTGTTNNSVLKAKVK